jgi:hypothetical protein
MHFFLGREETQKREKGKRKQSCKVSRSVRWATKREVTNVVKVVLLLFLFSKQRFWGGERKRGERRKKNSQVLEMRQARLEELQRQLAKVLARNVPEQNYQDVQT